MLDRKRIGARIKGLRTEQGLDQVEVARKAGISTGTLQTIEWGARENKLANLDKVARVLGTTLDALERKPNLDLGDPLLRGLNREDLEIARAYHEASSTVRMLARQLLRDRDPQEQTTPVSEAAGRLIDKLTPKQLGAIEQLIAVVLENGDEDAETG